MELIKLFVNTNDNKQIKEIRFPSDKAIGYLIKELEAVITVGEDYLEDNEIYLKDSNVQFDKGMTSEELGLKNKDHLFIGKCNRIQLTVEYAGRPISESFGPATSIDRIFNWVIEKYGISQNEVPKLTLRDSDKERIDRDQLLGSFVKYPNCSVIFYLTSKRDIQG